jgi:hypothetical protein
MKNDFPLKSVVTMDQNFPAIRTVKEMIEILKQYPEDTIVTGVREGTFTQFSTVQGNNNEDLSLNNVGIYFWKEDE